MNATYRKRGKYKIINFNLLRLSLYNWYFKQYTQIYTVVI